MSIQQVSIPVDKKTARQERINKSLQPWSREKCNVLGFGGAACLVDMFVSPKLTAKIITSKNITKPYANMSIGAFIGIGTMALGALSGYLLNKHEVKTSNNTKIGNFFYKLFNGPIVKIENK